MLSALTQITSPIRVTDHPDLPSYLRGLRECDLLFVPRTTGAARMLASTVFSPVRLHVLKDVGACIGVTNLLPEDLPALRSSCDSVFVQNASTASSRRFPNANPIADLAKCGFRLFFPSTGDARLTSSLRQYGLVSLTEFALSDAGRIAEYPLIRNGTSVGLCSRIGHAGPRTVFMLALVQDFEVLQPLMLRCAASMQWRDTYVAIGELVMKSPIWAKVEGFLNALRFSWFKAIGPLDVLNALGSGKALLVTASESTAQPHKLAHDVCRLAPPRTIKLTLQHGYECVGLRHHKAHSRTYSKGIRFASDFVFTWSNPADLPDLHPCDRDKCIPVGVVKSIADEVATFDDLDRCAVVDFDHGTNASPPFLGAAPVPVLIAENLHSVRFVDQARYKRFQDFILGANGHPGFAVTLRSHPAKPILQNGKDKASFSFLADELRARDLAKFRFAVSPPSTILLDTVLAGVPTAIWSDRRDLGDCENYPDLPAVCDLGDLTKLCREPDRLAEIQLGNFRWAAENLCAFNGAPQAWSRMHEFVSH